MGEARSRAHYRMVWEEEIKRLSYLGWSVDTEEKFGALMRMLGLPNNREDLDRLKEIQDELRGIVKRGALSVKKPDVCPKCGEEDYFCAYRKDCPERYDKDELPSDEDIQRDFAK